MHNAIRSKDWHPKNKVTLVPRTRLNVQDETKASARKGKYGVTDALIGGSIRLQR